MWLPVGLWRPSARHAHEVPVNAPIVVDNGGAIYDLERETYVVKNFLPEIAPIHIAAIAERFPHGALELYPDADFGPGPSAYCLE